MKAGKKVNLHLPTKVIRDRSLLLLCLLGLLIIAVYARNASAGFDDLYLPHMFSTMVGQYGYIKTIGIILSGADLGLEYRTYGLSRLLQFGIWSVVGSQSRAYPIIISLSQLGLRSCFCY